MRGRVAVVVAPGQPMEIREYEVTPPGPGQILIRVTTAGVCGSDLHMWRGEMGWLQRTPGVPGHEGTGVVAGLGRDRQTDSLGRRLREGDRVAYAYFVPCGECWTCLGGNPGCPDRYRFVRALTADDEPHFHGAYGDYYYLHPGQWVFAVPAGLPDELVAPVNCAVSQMVYGLHKIGVWLGDTVVFQGAGGLGLYGLAIARDMGAGRLIAIDGVPERLALARQFGATDVISLAEFPTREARVARVRELTGGVGADVCVEVAGVPAAMQEGLELTRAGGRYLMIGNIVAGAAAPVVPHDAIRSPKQIQGVLAYDRWVIPRALDWLARARDRYPFAAMVGGTYELPDINRAFVDADWAASRGQVGRAIIRMS